MNSVNKLARTLYARFSDDVLLLAWARDGILANNWGDKLNPFLARLLSQRNVLHVRDLYGHTGKPVHVMIGSTLSAALEQGRTVWGTGFLYKDAAPRAAGADIRAVRGYLSRDRLRALGIDCPDVVGDPALLLPRFYTPGRASRRYRLGIIPHCRELDMPLVQASAFDDDTLLIDVTGGILPFVDQLCSCDFVASSSLHGLICAEAYGIPARWIRLSDRPRGDGFKFHDFYSSLGRQTDGPVTIGETAQFRTVRDGFREPKGSIDLDRLLEACPFLADR